MGEEAIDPGQRNEEEGEAGEAQMLRQQVRHHGAGVAQPVGGGGIGGMIEGRIGRGPGGQRQSRQGNAAQQDEARKFVGAVPDKAAEGRRNCAVVGVVVVMDGHGVIPARTQTRRHNKWLTATMARQG